MGCGFGGFPRDENEARKPWKIVEQMGQILLSGMSFRILLAWRHTIDSMNFKVSRDLYFRAGKRFRVRANLEKGSPSRIESPHRIEETVLF